jgi:precorrin-2 dehydrogenase / sirohydrochlorin ferrochelatase
VLTAIARAGTITIAVSTDGASPALARRVRDHCARLLTPEVAELAEHLRAERRALQAAGGSTEAVDWSPRIDPVLPPPEPLS